METSVVLQAGRTDRESRNNIIDCGYVLVCFVCWPWVELFIDFDECGDWLYIKLFKTINLQF